MIRINNIQISKIKEFIHSEEFRKLKNIPISLQRAIAQFNNPRANKNDYVLFLAYDDDKLIGYLGALPDFIYNTDKKFKVAWLSCMWVDKEYRRSGIAYQLMNHANKAWDSNLLISNFIPQSKLVFDKTKTYTDFITLSGIRGYLRFDIAGILSRKKVIFKNIKPLLIFSDFILNIFNEVRLFFWKLLKKSPDYKIEYVKEIDNKTDEFIKKFDSQSLTRKQKKEFDWMINYPWVREGKTDHDSKRYEFSSVAKKFSYMNIKAINKKDELIAFLILTKHNSFLKTPYLFFDNEYIKVVKDVIIDIAIKLKVKTFTTYNKDLTNYLLKKPSPFITVRKMKYQSIITKELAKKIGDTKNIDFYEGDGDGAFT